MDMISILFHFDRIFLVLLHFDWIFWGLFHLNSCHMQCVTPCLGSKWNALPPVHPAGSVLTRHITSCPVERIPLHAYNFQESQIVL